MRWEVIDAYHQRCKVPGGWLVKTYEDVITLGRDVSVGYEFRVAMCFLPDPQHQWEPKKEC